VSTVVWTDELSIGVVEADAEHRNLVAIIGQLEDAIINGKDARFMGEVLTKLVEYTGIHFISEEQLMLNSQYPAYEAHRAQHAQLVKKLEKFRFEFMETGERMTQKDFGYLVDWLTNHILVDDMTFGAHHARWHAATKSTTAV